MDLLIKRHDRIEWVKTLKINQRVYCSMTNMLYTIKNITKMGKLRLSNNVLLDETGCSWYHEIHPLNESILKHTGGYEKLNAVKIDSAKKLLFEIGFKKSLRSDEYIKIYDLFEKLRNYIKWILKN